MSKSQLGTLLAVETSQAGHDRMTGGYWTSVRKSPDALDGERPV